MISCAYAGCTFQVTDERHYQLHSLLEHSNLRSQITWQLLQNITTELSTTTRSQVALTLLTATYVDPKHGIFLIIAKVLY